MYLFFFRQSAAKQMNMVTIYDIQNKFVGTFQSNLHLTSWNGLVINKPISECVRTACDGSLTTSLLRVVDDTDA